MDNWSRKNRLSCNRNNNKRPNRKKAYWNQSEKWKKKEKWERYVISQFSNDIQEVSLQLKLLAMLTGRTEYHK